MLVTTERQWQMTVVHGALVNRWEVALRIEDATYRVLRKSDAPDTGKALKMLASFPDLLLVQPQWRRMLFVELKLDKASSQPSEGQKEKLALLFAAGADVRIWRPQDWNDEVSPTLMNRTPSATRGIEEVESLYRTLGPSMGWL